MQLSDRRAFPRSIWNLNRKTALWRWKNTPTAFVRGTISLEPTLDITQVHNFKKEGIISFLATPRTLKTDDGSYVNRVRENWQNKENVCRFLPTLCKLIHKLETLRKIATPATRRNSRFAGSISRLAGIFARKTRKNSSDHPNSGSHKFSIQTPIHVNFISLESILLELSNGTLHDPFWAPEGLKKCPKNWVRKLYGHANRGGFAGGATWQLHAPRSLSMLHTCGVSPPCAKFVYKLDPPSPHSKRLGSDP